ncbi:MAG TPA: response regulator [Gemmatimonadales bacterium]|nr:response regulator [Gemmatimonadales bacterium]
MDYAPALLPALPAAPTVLIVDDVDIVLRSTARMLAEEGYRAYETGSAAEAVEVLRTSKQPIDLAIVDVVMPDVNGIAFSHLLRQQWPRTRLLFMSAHGAEILAQEGLREFNAPFLAKPFTRPELLQKLHETLGRRGVGPSGSADASPRREPPGIELE